MSSSGNKPGAGGGNSGAYAGLVGLGDTDRLDSSLYDEQVDFDFFETNAGRDSPVNSSGLTVTVEPPTPVPGPKNNLLLQVAPSQTPFSVAVSTSSSADADTDTPPFSTHLLMAALQDTNTDNDGSDSPSSQDKEQQEQQPVRVHLFDLTDSEDDDADELELAEINGQVAQADVAGQLHSWEAHDFYHHQHLQQQHERAQRQKKKLRVHAAAQEPAGVLGRRSVSDDDRVNDESSDDDEEGYYLSDSERSDITDVTPMSSVACSPMPPFAGSTNGTAPYSGGLVAAPGESDDSFDGYPINREAGEEGSEDCDGLEDELGRITPSEDDDDIDEILRILPNSATGQHFEIPTEGDVDPFMKMYRDGPNSPPVDAHEEEDREKDYNNQYTMNSVSAGLDRHYYSVSTEIANETAACDKKDGAAQRPMAAALAGGNGNNLLTVNYGNTSKSYVDAQRRRMLAAAHAHHTARHHGLANGAGPKLNKLHHPGAGGHGHGHAHHHHHNHHGPGSYFYGTGHGGHHFNHHHAHHHNNYHQQYHNLTMALQRKRQNQQKQIDHDNSILKRKLQSVKPSLDILKAFGPGVVGSVITSSSTSSSSAGTPAPNDNKKKGSAPKCGGDGGYASSTASSTTTSSSSSSNVAASSGSDKN